MTNSTMVSFCAKCVNANSRTHSLSSLILLLLPLLFSLIHKYMGCTSLVLHFLGFNNRFAQMSCHYSPCRCLCILFREYTLFFFIFSVHQLRMSWNCGRASAEQKGNHQCVSENGELDTGSGGCTDDWVSLGEC